MSLIRLLLPALPPASAAPPLCRTLHAWPRPVPARGLEALLHACFHPPAGAVPVAPLALLGEGTDPGPWRWMRADPVHLQAADDQVRVAACGELDLGAAQAGELVAALHAHFSADGLALLAPHPQRWYLRADDLGEGAPEPARVGAALDACLPAGPQGRNGRRFCNEAQMLLHAHPVNLAREARGQPPVNGLWLWGAGQLPATPGEGWDAAWGGSALLGGLARHAGVSLHAAPADASGWLPALPPGRHLLMPDGPAAEGPALDRLWLAPLLRALWSGQLARLEVACAGPAPGLWRIRRRDLWRFWRALAAR